MEPEKHRYIATYAHHDGCVGVLVEFLCRDTNIFESEKFIKLTDDITKHVAACNPMFLFRAEATTNNSEISSNTNIDDYLRKTCLLEQPFVIHPELKVGDIIATCADELHTELSIVRFVRWTTDGSQQCGGVVRG